MFRAPRSLLGLVVLAPLASAQSFNVDIGATTVLPPPTYGAAAGQAGVWNAVSPTVFNQAIPLVGLNGAASTATLKSLPVFSSILASSFNIPSTSGLDEMLLDDMVVPSPLFGPSGAFAEGYYQIDGLVPGLYDLYVYSVGTSPSGPTASIVTINGQSPLFVTGQYPGANVLGQSYVIQTVTTSTGTIPFEVKAVPNTFTGWFNGLQIVRRDSPSTPFCTGDAVGSTCLGCGNNGAVGHGCANSSFASGARLTSIGYAGTSALSDTLVLTATNLPGPGLFIQGSNQTAPVTFGDGMRCVGVVVRLGVVTPTGGTASYPGGLTPQPIHVAGGPLTSGDVRHYQCWYRDSAVFCGPGTFNMTQGLTLTFGP